MACVKVSNGYTRVELDSSDTWEWAHRPGAKWPCSMASGREVFGEFDSRGDLVDYGVRDEGASEWRQGIRGEPFPADEFSAIMSDHLPVGHPARR